MWVAMQQTIGCSLMRFFTDIERESLGVIPRFGDWNIVYQRFNRWAKSGVFDRRQFGTWWYVNAAAAPLLQQSGDYVTIIKNEVNTNVRTASRAIGGVMVSAALVQHSSAEVFLASQIQAFIAQRLRVDIASMDARSHLTDDFGLDLFEITELLTALEERFGVDAEAADEPDQIDFVGDLIRYIESRTNGRN